jgi:diaminopimelate decarboxylase
VHLHIGSQILETESFSEAVRQISAFQGPVGLRHRRWAGRPLHVRGELRPTIDRVLGRHRGRRARRVAQATRGLLIEPGRSLVARAGMTLYRVVSVKRTGRNFVAVDGGMADNLDIALTGQRYEAVIDGRVLEFGDTSCVVVGQAVRIR